MTLREELDALMVQAEWDDLPLSTRRDKLQELWIEMSDWRMGCAAELVNRYATGDLIPADEVQMTMISRERHNKVCNHMAGIITEQVRENNRQRDEVREQVEAACAAPTGCPEQRRLEAAEKVCEGVGAYHRGEPRAKEQMYQWWREWERMER